MWRSSQPQAANSTQSPRLSTSNPEPEVLGFRVSLLLTVSAHHQGADTLDLLLQTTCLYLFPDPRNLSGKERSPEKPKADLERHSGVSTDGPPQYKPPHNQPYEETKRDPQPSETSIWAGSCRKEPICMRGAQGLSSRGVWVRLYAYIVFRTIRIRRDLVWAR